MRTTTTLTGAAVAALLGSGSSLAIAQEQTGLAEMAMAIAAIMHIASIRGVGALNKIRMAAAR